MEFDLIIADVDGIVKACVAQVATDARLHPRLHEVESLVHPEVIVAKLGEADKEICE